MVIDLATLSSWTITIRIFTALTIVYEIERNTDSASIRTDILVANSAAGIWAAALDLAVGIGFYQGALVASLFIFFILPILYPLCHRLSAQSRFLYFYEVLDDISHFGLMTNRI